MIRDDDDRLDVMWKMQRDYASQFYDVDDMTLEEKENKTRELALALHHDVSQLVSSMNFRRHRTGRRSDRHDDMSHDKTIYDVVDIVRYAMAIANLHGFDSYDFEQAWISKDAYLRDRLYLDSHTWDGESPVLICDIDDVLADFRVDFARWIFDTKNVVVDPNSREYFFIEELSESGYSTLGLYDEFVADRQISKLTPNTCIVNIINELYEQGVWIYLITARPYDNPLCRYDTYDWLRGRVKYDDISFTSDKLAHILKTDYHTSGKILAAIEDGPQHVTAYASHGIRTYVPKRSYNESVAGKHLVDVYTHPEQLRRSLNELLAHVRR